MKVIVVVVITAIRILGIIVESNNSNRVIVVGYRIFCLGFMDAKTLKTKFRRVC